MPRSAGPSFWSALAGALILASLGSAEARGEKRSIPGAFSRHIAELLPGAKAKLKELAATAECPGSTIDAEVIVGADSTTDDPLFLETLAEARQDALEKFLPTIGFAPGSFTVTHVIDLGRGDDVQVRYGSEPPRLHTDSVPAKGSKVQAGDVIKVTMTARDDVDPWQAGIDTLQLTAEPGGLVKSGNYSRALACKPKGQTPDPLPAEYTVPRNPAPIIRLTAIATDFAGKETSKSAQFPTGDWYGTMTVRREILRTGYFHEMNWTFAVSHVPSERDARMPDGELIRGEVRGRAVGQIAYSDVSRLEECTFTHTIRPAFFHIDVTGEAFFKIRSQGGNGELDRLIVNLGTDVAETRRTRCIRGFDETTTRPLYDAKLQQFDHSPTRDGNHKVVPSIKSDNRVTITLELHQARQ